MLLRWTGLAGWCPLCTEGKHVQIGYLCTSQTASTNWTGQSRLFCSGWELDTTDLTPTCTTNSRLASLRCAHATQTSWLQNTYCSIVHYMMLWGGTHGRNRRLWGTSCMATWRSWGGQPPLWGQQASPSSVQWRRRRRIFVSCTCQAAFHGCRSLTSVSYQQRHMDAKCSLSKMH